ncbi:MAG: TIGR03790 family protein [Verrucomicrobia bacterium]|nr:TIGR03790 family protein [Verrucomicrobiota bacterium]
MGHARATFFWTLLLLLSLWLPRETRAQNLELSAGAPSSAPTPLAADDPENVAPLAAVVYNEDDALSSELAFYYAEKRGIPRERLVALHCSGEEEISREEYDRTIAGPLRHEFDVRGWWQRSPDRAPSGPDDHTPTSVVFENKIRYLVLLRGVPVKIKPAPNYPGDFSPTGQPEQFRSHNEAAVDSELAALGFFLPGISGAASNPYFRQYARIQDAGMPGLLLVGRLDGPTGRTVRRMIDDTLYAERNGLWGRAYVDTRGLPHDVHNGLFAGDVWLEKAAADLGPHGVPTVLDRRPELFGVNYPMSEAAIYYGWYSEQPVGPFTRSSFRFQRGAVAYHLHSYSAAVIRDPTHQWVGPLLESGAAATMGCVYEPYLGLTPRIDTFNARLLDGFTFGEAAYQAAPVLSWMTTVVGDPLYRPARVWEIMGRAADGSPELPRPDSAAVAEYRAFWRGANAWRLRSPEEGAAELERSGRTLKSGRIFEGLGLLQVAAGERTRAAKSFEQATQFYPDASDVARVALHEARSLADAGEKPAAIELLRRTRARIGGGHADAVEALKEMENELAPSAAPSPK